MKKRQKEENRETCTLHPFSFFFFLSHVDIYYIFYFIWWFIVTCYFPYVLHHKSHACILPTRWWWWYPPFSHYIHTMGRAGLAVRLVSVIVLTNIFFLSTFHAMRYQGKSFYYKSVSRKIKEQTRKKRNGRGWFDFLVDRVFYLDFLFACWVIY